MTITDHTTTSGSIPAAAPRRGAGERIESGIYRRHEVGCTAKRCDCPYLIAYRADGHSCQETVHGSLGAARKRRAAGIAQSTPTARPTRSPRIGGNAPMEPTLDAHFQDLIVRRSASGIWSYNTAKRHEEVWTGGLSEHFGGLSTGEVPTRTERAWEAFLAAQAGRTSHHLQAKRTLSVLFQTLEKEQLIRKNPAGRLHVPARSPEDAQQVGRVLTSDELALLLREGATSIRQRTLIAALAMGGLRRGEVLALCVGEIDLSGGVVRLERQAIPWERESDEDGTTLVAAHRRIDVLKGRQRRDWHLPPRVPAGSPSTWPPIPAGRTTMSGRAHGACHRIRCRRRRRSV